MPSLTWIAYFCWVLAAIALAIAIGDENPFVLVPAVSLAISGVLFAAFERVISLLTDIRNALTAPVEASQAFSNETPSDETPLETKSLEEISADLKRLKEKAS